jgi:hypothetical protein
MFGDEIKYICRLCWQFIFDVSDCQQLLRKKRSRAAPASATPPTVEPVTLAPFATPSMAKTLRNYSTPIVANVPVGPTVNVGDGNFELRTDLITMVQANQFHGLSSEEQARISNTSSGSVTLSSSRTLSPQASGSTCFPFPSHGRRSSGSIRKRKLSRRGINVPRCSSPSSSPWAKSTPWGDEFQTSSKAPWKQFPRHRRGYRTTSKHARTTGLKTS